MKIVNNTIYNCNGTFVLLGTDQNPTITITSSNDQLTLTSDNSQGAIESGDISIQFQCGNFISNLLTIRSIERNGTIMPQFYWSDLGLRDCALTACNSADGFNYTLFLQSDKIVAGIVFPISVPLGEEITLEFSFEDGRK